jgi:hypothetical protein
LTKAESGVERLGAYARAGDMALLEQHQRRDGAHAERLRELLGLVAVDLADDERRVVRLEGLQRRHHLLARAAPRRPEVDECYVGREEFFLKLGGVIDVNH